MKQYIIFDLTEGLVNITEDQLLEIGGSSGGSVYANTISDRRIYYTDSNVFTIPETGTKLLYFNLNGGSQLNSWTQVGNVVTYTGDHVLVAGDYFQYAGNKSIEFLDDLGFNAETVLNLPQFENEIEAVSLPNFTPYRTSTGEIRFKLPTLEPTGLWNFTAIWDFNKIWNI